MAVTLAFIASGCAYRAGQGREQAVGRANVSFPRVKLAQGEYVQSLTVEIRRGRVVSINRLLEDWDVELAWDSPELFELKLQARHFSSGLSDLSVLDDFITIENSAGGSFAITANLRTDSTDPTGRGEKQYALSHAEFILKPVRSLGPIHPGVR